MSNYWIYWKRGWWVWLMSLCLQLATAVFVLPLAFAFHGRPGLYLSSAAVVGIFAIIPLWGWIFERFAARSDRILPAERAGEPTSVRGSDVARDAPSTRDGY
ncbi:MAG TPA: hypothetical protein VLF18_07710 [Tahibacter sp.]|uniref:hypothetical protein n=1 Tax=Tahibacter sp. TaxID=2056211 RepID=UPI002C615A1B|nr:hypothetical protein [Tahibacter sp.]HSX60066.1 hypothetical protein [Tahibacter sp.]